MSTQGIFHQRGNTRRILATETAMINAVKVTTASGFPKATNYVITNFGPSVAYVGHGPDPDTAIANAAVPVASDATGAFCFVVPPGQRSIEAKDDAWFAAITSAGSADLLITPGHGLVDGFGEGLVNSEVTAFAAMRALLEYSSGRQQEMLQEIAVELRVITHFLKEGLNVAEDPDSARSDNAASFN